MTIQDTFLYYFHVLDTPRYVISLDFHIKIHKFGNIEKYDLFPVFENMVSKYPKHFRF